MSALVSQFIRSSTWHGSLDEAQSLLASHPEIADADIHTAAILGDAKRVRAFIERDPTNVHATREPYGANALVHLCLSKYLRLEPARGEDFVRAATALLDAGADPNSGFWTTGDHPEYESALYGAAGVAHHPELTHLLLERGADPNDGEVAYHTPEGYDNRALRVLLETGRITPNNRTLMLIRKHDWHDDAGARLVLSYGVELNPPEHETGWPAPLHHAIRRDNSLEMIALLFDHGADPRRTMAGMTAIERAARHGRGDVLASLRRRGVALDLTGVAALIAGCAERDEASVRSIATEQPHLVRALLAESAELLGRFALTDNPTGVRLLLDLGAPITARWQGDGYWGIPPDSTTLHVAAALLRPAVVALLLARGAEVNARDGAGRTPLALAIRASVESYWSERRDPDLIGALLRAGASVDDVPFPTGYPEADDLLRAHGR
jgi:ankyrin repeat protein